MLVEATLGLATRHKTTKWKSLEKTKATSSHGSWAFFHALFKHQKKLQDNDARKRGKQKKRWRAFNTRLDVDGRASHVWPRSECVMKNCGRNGNVQRWLIALISVVQNNALRYAAERLPSTNVHRWIRSLVTSFYIDDRLLNTHFTVSLRERKMEFNDDVCPSELILWDESQGSVLDR